MADQEALKPFLDKEYRDAYLDSHVKGGIAYQIQALREKTRLSQTDFGAKIGKPQSVVSRLEDTEYGTVAVQTLVDIAKALDVALQIRFSNYIDMLSSDVSEAAFMVDDVYESYSKCASSGTNISSVTQTENRIILVVVNSPIPKIIDTNTNGGVSWQSQ